jgi:ABC-2 type transport system permease protein
MGKLVGVSFVALTQLAIWGLAFSAFALYGVGVLASRGISASIPGTSVFTLHLLRTLLSARLLHLRDALCARRIDGHDAARRRPAGDADHSDPRVSFYLFLPVSRSPDSPFSFWVSIIPFSAPVAMLVRIVTQTPPFWQIALSLLIGFGTVLIIMWAASRIYRVGMLMYGKRASIPEAIRWARQA